MRRKGITPATVLMVSIAVAFAVFLAATRFGMDVLGPPAHDLLQRLHDATGWYEGAKAADR